ncbi:hypothetical protein QBC35DRAFT_551017 [Podospora australis]|uniref:Uncharacterized protein n=1 Tax=Podospora australis TaxID=1536484 RepID=A0AAN7AGI3_9PEZI|nr:hypothetical protein QBC35DRAFT_551017 [Podospora australis]
MTVTSSQMAQSSVIAPEDARDLRSRGLLLDDSKPGWCRLHKRAIFGFDFHDPDVQNIPLIIDPNSAAASDAFGCIPEHVISREALMDAGLSDARADSIWHLWTHRQAENSSCETDPDETVLQADFLKFVLDQFLIDLDARGEDDDEWYRSLEQYGLSEKLIEAFMDPDCRYQRLDDTCHYWVTDTIRMCYTSLQLSAENITLPGKNTQRQGGSSVTTTPSQRH